MTSITWLIVYYLVTRAIATYILALDYRDNPHQRDETVGWTAAAWCPIVGELVMIIIYGEGLTKYLIPAVLKSLSGVE